MRVTRRATRWRAGLWALLAPAPRFPRLRWAALAWMGVWVPVYAIYWGWRNFLALCDVGVALACLGVWRASPLLLSSQALPALTFGMLWTTDFGGRLATGKHLFGGTEYMLDRAVPMPVRLMSLFHVAMPVVLLRLVQRTGYDRRAWWWQSGLTLGVLAASRLVTGPEKNLNYAFKEPLLHRSFAPAALHVTLVWAFISTVIYLPAHVVLRRAFRASR